jgi:hypothetical protein
MYWTDSTEQDYNCNQKNAYFLTTKSSSYLGYTISDKGIEASPEKVKAIQEYPTPKTVKDARAFLGLASFYIRLVPNFAHIAKPMTQVTRKDKKFDWDKQCQEAFETLKHKLSLSRF